MSTNFVTYLHTSKEILVSIPFWHRWRRQWWRQQYSLVMSHWWQIRPKSELNTLCVWSDTTTLFLQVKASERALIKNWKSMPERALRISNDPFDCLLQIPVWKKNPGEILEIIAISVLHRWEYCFDIFVSVQIFHMLCSNKDSVTRVHRPATMNLWNIVQQLVK